MKKRSITTALVFLLLSSFVYADVLVADFPSPRSGPKQPFPPGRYVRLMVDGCQGGCDIAVRLPNGTSAYIAQNFSPNPNCGLPGGVGCYIDYLTPELEGKYDLQWCSRNGPECSLPEPNGGYFYVKRMPALEDLKRADEQMQAQISEHETNIRDIEGKIAEIVRLSWNYIACILKGTGLKC